MRVIAGTARGRRLVTRKGAETRPTADRVREALFSVLFSLMGSLDGKRVLDLFAGSGALAIEALSRGSAQAWLVENSPEAVKAIEKNLISCRFSDHATLVARDVFQAQPTLQRNGPFDLIFADPPYAKGLALKTLQSVAQHGLLAKDGYLSIETAAEESLPPQLGNLVAIGTRRYGATMLHLFTCIGQD